MSGPKGFELVLLERARIARETDNARAECLALLARRDAAAVALGALTKQMERPRKHVVATLDLAGARALAVTVTAEVADYESRLRDVRVQAVREHLSQAFSALGPDSLELPELPGRAPAPRHTARSSGPSTDRLQGRLQRAVAAMAEVDEAPRQQLTAQAEIVAGLLRDGELIPAQAAILGLQSLIDGALRAQRVRDEVRAKAADLIVRIAHVETPEADAVRARALACLTPAELAEAAEAEQVLLAAHRARQDREFVIASTRAALTELGYEVGEEFVAAALGGEGAIATSPALPGYGLQWRFVPGSNRVLTNVVAFGDGSPQRDAEVEVSTCHHIDTVVRAWRDDGVEAALGHHREPGRVPVERAAARPRARWGNSTLTAADRARSMGTPGGSA